MRFLNGLLSRALQIGLGKANQGQNESTHSVNPEEKKKEFSDLVPKEKEILVTKLLKLLDNQLEVIPVYQQIDVRA